MEAKKESILTGYPNFIPLECAKKITEQMEKNICKIKIGNEQGTGFFCKIPFPNKNNMLPVFITNNHIINNELLYKKDEKILVYIEETDTKKINLDNRLKYTNEEYDVTIIEIKDSDSIEDFLELDENLINNIINDRNKNDKYLDETIYIIQYPEGKLSVSYGIIDKIYEDKKYNFIHKSSTKGGSSGSPILNINNNKIIGIHKEGNMNRFNKGTFLNYPIKEFIKQNIVDKNSINIIEEKIDDQKENLRLLILYCKRYGLKIKQNNNILNLNSKNLSNGGLNELCELNLSSIKLLNLRMSSISNIEMFEKVNFENLEILNLNNNEIRDISVLKKLNLKKIKELYFLDNHIIDINALEKVKLESLEILDFGWNEIADINVLGKINLKELKKLSLEHNKISDIKVLGNMNFGKLTELYLEDNNIDKRNNSSIISQVKSQIKNFYI